MEKIRLANYFALICGFSCHRRPLHTPSMPDLSSSLGGAIAQFEAWKRARAAVDSRLRDLNGATQTEPLLSFKSGLCDVSTF